MIFIPKFFEWNVKSWNWWIYRSFSKFRIFGISCDFDIVINKMWDILCIFCAENSLPTLFMIITTSKSLMSHVKPKHVKHLQELVSYSWTNTHAHPKPKLTSICYSKFLITYGIHTYYFYFFESSSIRFSWTYQIFSFF